MPGLVRFCPCCGAEGVAVLPVQVFVQAGASWGDHHEMEELGTAYRCGTCGGEFIADLSPLPVSPPPSGDGFGGGAEV